MKDDIDEDKSEMSSASNLNEISTQYGNARATRNLAEKQRRDNLNNNIALMAALVPVVAGSSRRQDKISILRLAAAFLRSHYTVGSPAKEFLPQKFNDIDLEQSFLDSFDGSGGFLIVVTSSGNIVHISRNIEGPLGHAPNELMGKSLYNYVHPEDHPELAKNLSPNDTLSAISDVSNNDDESNSSDDSSQAQSNYNDNTFQEQRRNFNIKFAQRTNSRGEHTQYKCFNITGMLRLSNYCRNRPGRSRNTTNNDIIFVGIARQLQRRFTKLSLFEASKEEYVTRHLVDGRIVFCDHRISVVAGYMSEEVSGSSAFRYMHKDDVRWTIIALRQMYDCRLEFGASCYRLLSKTGEFIYLRTHGFLEFDKQTGTFESFVCVNTLVDEEEGEKLIKEMKERFSAIITNSNNRSIIEADPQTSKKSEEPPSVEDPSQLEGVILQLINGLSPSPTVGDVPHSTSPSPEIQYAKAAMYSQQMPPIDIHARQIGLSPKSPSSQNGKGKRVKLQKKIDITDQNHHNVKTQSSIKSLHNYQVSGNLIAEPNERITESEIVDDNTTLDKGLSLIHQPSYQSRNKIVFEEENDTLCNIHENQNMLNPSISHRLDNMVMYIKTESVDQNLNDQSAKRPLDDDDSASETSSKKKRQENYNNSHVHDKSSLKDIMKSNPEILKMLDTIGNVLNSEPDPSRSPTLCQQYASEQVDETLRNLEDRIIYQENQLDEIGLVIENSDVSSQRNNYDQLQAEHEIQKKMIKTLQKDHHSMKV